MDTVPSASDVQRLMDDMLAGVEGACTYVGDTFCVTGGLSAQLCTLHKVLL
jgi:hypothetical protein